MGEKVTHNSNVENSMRWKGATFITAGCGTACKPSSLPALPLSLIHFMAEMLPYAGQHCKISQTQHHLPKRTVPTIEKRHGYRRKTFIIFYIEATETSSDKAVYSRSAENQGYYCSPAPHQPRPGSKWAASAPWGQRQRSPPVPHAPVLNRQRQYGLGGPLTQWEESWGPYNSLHHLLPISWHHRNPIHRSVLPPICSTSSHQELSTQHLTPAPTAGRRPGLPRRVWSRIAPP